MHTKDIAEIRRRFRAEKSSISRVRGCYVNEQGEMVAEFDQALGLMPQDEAEELLALLRKTLSGAQGKNLHEVTFSTAQVLEGAEHKLLSSLRNSALQDEAAVKAFFAQVIGSVSMDSAYMILLAADKYDVPGYAADGSRQEDSVNTFSYIVCSICPVKLTRSGLGFVAHESRFCQRAGDSVIAPPELGFMFPGFDRRAANLYEALYYTRNTADNHENFVHTVLGSELPPPAAVQKETFAAILSESVAEDCSYEVAQAVHEHLCEMAEEQKASRRDEDDVYVSKHVVREVLEDCGVPEERIAVFEQRYDSEFGANTELPPANLVDRGRFDVKTPDVVIRVNPEASDLVQTRVINGEKYIMIRAEAGVEVNGVPIRIIEE